VTDPRKRQLGGGASAGGEPDPNLQSADASASGDELRELREVVSLLRALPDPAPPERLTERVMERVSEIESRPWYRGAWQGGVAPVLGSALAAGIAGVLFFTVNQGGPLAPTERNVRNEVLLPTPMTNTAIVAGRTPTRARRSPASRRSPAALAGFQVGDVSGAPQAFDPVDFSPVASTHARSIERDLDRQLNSMLLDPDGFFQRLETISSRDRFVARLAARAARRGDAIPMALRLRAMPYRYAGPTSEEFLKASNVSFASNR